MSAPECSNCGETFAGKGGTDRKGNPLCRPCFNLWSSHDFSTTTRPIPGCPWCEKELARA